MRDMQNDYSPHEQYPIFRAHLPYGSNMEFAMDRQAILADGKNLLNRFRNKDFMAEPLKRLFDMDIHSTAFQPRLF